MHKRNTPEEKWRQESEAAKAAAARLPPGSKEREDLLRQARQLETASHICEWLTSSGLSPPT